MSMHTSFVCKDCLNDFPTAKAFSNHFEREEGSIQIIGCEPVLPFNNGGNGKQAEMEAR